MRFWFSRDSHVPIREQLVTQVILGIVGGELAAGERLPSTRELARRFHLHANTISAGYRELEGLQWVELRHGSGVYVRNSKPQDGVPEHLELDQLIGKLFREARDLGEPIAMVRSRLEHWLRMQPPDHFLLIEADEELRAIVVAEMSSALKLPVKSAGLEALRSPEVLESGLLVALPSSREKVSKLLPGDRECITLQVRSVTSSLAQWIPARRDVLIGVASRWPGFLKHARTMLIAAGFDAETLVIRDARKAGWQRSLKAAAVIVCDSVTATMLPADARPIVYPLLSDSALAELRRQEQFVIPTPKASAVTVAKV